MTLLSEKHTNVQNHWSTNLLSDCEYLVIELLDELCCHFVWVIGIWVNIFLLQEVYLNSHSANTLLGLIKVIQRNCEKRKTFFNHDFFQKNFVSKENKKHNYSFNEKHGYYELFIIQCTSNASVYLIVSLFIAIALRND